MTHRARLVAVLVLALIVGGFVLNMVSTKKQTAADPAARQASVAKQMASRPVESLYVPRPVTLIYGRSLTSQSSAEQVAKAFAISYYIFDTTKQQPSSFAAALPRVAPHSREAITRTVTDLWHGFNGTPATSRVLDTSKVTATAQGGTQVSTTVIIQLTQHLTQEGAGPQDIPVQMSIEMVGGTEDTGWMVSGVETNG